jgi:hypothetical protein
MPFTLDFLRDMSAAWGVAIEWVEFHHEYKSKSKRRTRSAKSVDYSSASRNGEPFDMLLDSKGIVPDRSRRFCTQELKVMTTIRWIVQTRKWKHWTNVVGFRADESVRVSSKRAQEAAEPGCFDSIFPLDDAGVELLDVLRFWKTSPFDLQLDSDGDGGNCDGCFMFSTARIGRMFQKYPARMDWWTRTEQFMGKKTMRPKKQSYASIRDEAAADAALAWDDADVCLNGCGV